MAKIIIADQCLKKKETKTNLQQQTDFSQVPFS